MGLALVQAATSIWRRQTYSSGAAVPEKEEVVGSDSSQSKFYYVTAVSVRLTFVSGLRSGSRAPRGALDVDEGLEDEATEVLFSDERGQSLLSRAAASDITEWLWASSGFEPFRCRSGRRRWAKAASAVRLLIESFL